MTIGDVASMIVALATVGSLLYISRQVNVTRQQAKGQFLLALDQQFEKTNLVMTQTLGDPAFTPVGAQWYDIWRLMSVFERINIMVEDNILDIGLVDRLYSFQLMRIIGNETIYQNLLASGVEWQDFIDLCHALADHWQHDPRTADQYKTFIERVRKLDKQAHSAKSPWAFA